MREGGKVTIGDPKGLWAPLAAWQVGAGRLHANYVADAIEDPVRFFATGPSENCSDSRVWQEPAER